MALQFASIVQAFCIFQLKTKLSLYLTINKDVNRCKARSNSLSVYCCLMPSRFSMHDERGGRLLLVIPSALVTDPVNLIENGVSCLNRAVELVASSQ